VKVILISEARLDELVQAMLDHLAAKTQEPRDPDVRLSFRAVNYCVRELVGKIKDERGL